MTQSSSKKNRCHALIKKVNDTQQRSQYQVLNFHGPTMTGALQCGVSFPVLVKLNML
jgi:hypothetical protein